MSKPLNLTVWQKAICLFVLPTFTLIGFNLPLAQAQELILPVPGTMVKLSPAFNPPVLKGIKVHPENPFRFEFILDKGNETPAVAKGESTLAKEGNLKSESTKLIKYFLAALTTPEKDMWVNLSPYEKDRIVPKSFGQTEMGRDLLAQDYLLKQITASLVYPEGDIGKQFWKRVYQISGNKNVPVNMFNKVWIVPNKAVVYENAKAGTAYVVESSLKVMTEEDYLATSKNSPPLVGGNYEMTSQIVHDIVIPQLTKEVNEGKNFAQLRQVYNSLILATWYKKKIKDSILSQVYADKSKVKGTEFNDDLKIQSIYQRYLQAFKKGAYNYIKEKQDPATQQMIPQKYFSGGWSARGLDFAMSTTYTLDTDRISNRDANLVEVAAGLNWRQNNPREFISSKGKARFSLLGTISVSLIIAALWGINQNSETIQKDATNAVNNRGPRNQNIISNFTTPQAAEKVPSPTIPIQDREAQKVKSIMQRANELVIQANNGSVQAVFDLHELSGQKKLISLENDIIGLINKIDFTKIIEKAKALDHKALKLFWELRYRIDYETLGNAISEFGNSKGNYFETALSLKDWDAVKYLRQITASGAGMIIPSAPLKIEVETADLSPMKQAILNGDSKAEEIYVRYFRDRFNQSTVLPSNPKSESFLDQSVETAIRTGDSKKIASLLNAGLGDLDVYERVLKQNNLNSQKYYLAGLRIFQLVQNGKLSSAQQQHALDVLKGEFLNQLIKIADNGYRKYSAKTKEIMSKILNGLSRESDINLILLVQPEVIDAILNAGQGYYTKAKFDQMIKVSIEPLRENAQIFTLLDVKKFSALIQGLGLFFDSAMNAKNTGVSAQSSQDADMQDSNRQLMPNFFKRMVNYYFNPKYFETRRLYERLGVRHFQRGYDQFYLSLFNDKYDNYKLGSNETQLRRRLQIANKLEAWHLFIFMLGVENVVYYSTYGNNYYAAGAWAIFNAIGNGYPILSQRYLRLRIIEVLGKRYVKNVESEFVNVPSVNENSPQFGKNLDAAMEVKLDSKKAPGGIDFNSDKLNLQMQNSGQSIKFHMDPAMLKQLQDAPGFTPVIINIQPMQDLRLFLGIRDQKNQRL